MPLHVFVPIDINRKQHRMHRSKIIEQLIEIKHNTHKTQSGPWTQKEQHRKAPTNYQLFSNFIKPTDNNIGDTGAKALSDVLKSNTTLTKLNLSGGHKINNTQIAQINEHFFFHSHEINRQQD